MKAALLLCISICVHEPPKDSSPAIPEIARPSVPGKIHESESLDQMKGMLRFLQSARQKMKFVNMISFFEWCGWFKQIGTSLSEPGYSTPCSWRMLEACVMSSPRILP